SGSAQPGLPLALSDPVALVPAHRRAESRRAGAQPDVGDCGVEVPPRQDSPRRGADAAYSVGVKPSAAIAWAGTTRSRMPAVLGCSVPLYEKSTVAVCPALTSTFAVSLP